VRLKKNREYDERGSMMFMNQMFQRGQIEIHSSACRQLIMQLGQWRRSKGAPAKGLNLAKAFCNLLTRLREAKKMNAEERKPKYYRTDEEWEKTKREAMREYLTGEVR
jgi:ribonuclease HI